MFFFWSTSEAKLHLLLTTKISSSTVKPSILIIVYSHIDLRWNSNRDVDLNRHTANEDLFASITRIQNLASKSEKRTFRPRGQISQIRGGSYKASVEAFAEGLCCASGGDGGRQRVCLQTHKVCGLNVNGVRTKQPPRRDPCDRRSV